MRISVIFRWGLSIYFTSYCGAEDPGDEAWLWGDALPTGWDWAEIGLLEGGVAPSCCEGVGEFLSEVVPSVNIGSLPSSNQSYRRAGKRLVMAMTMASVGFACRWESDWATLVTRRCAPRSSGGSCVGVLWAAESALSFPVHPWFWGFFLLYDWFYKGKAIFSIIQMFL